MRLPSDHLNRVGLRATAAVVVRHSEGVFEAQFERAFALSSDRSVESRQPVLFARTIDVQALFKDTLLTVGDEDFRLKRQEPDGTGMTLVILKR